MHARKATSRAVRSILRRFSVALALGGLLAGCVAKVPGGAGETHHLIVGFGVVTTRDGGRDGVVATRAHALGLSVTDRPGLKLGMGYASSTVVSVADGAKDVRVEVSRRPGGPLIVEAPSVLLGADRVERHDEDSAQ
jgi:hypothetical protein